MLRDGKLEHASIELARSDGPPLPVAQLVHDVGGVLGFRFPLKSKIDLGGVSDVGGKGKATAHHADCDQTFAHSVWARTRCVVVPAF